MFEAMTFDFILNRILSRVDDKYDRREGSFFYNALAPATVEIAQMYEQADALIKQTFIGTAVGGYLDGRVAEFGMLRLAATKAIMRGRFNIPVQIGARFNGGEHTYIATKLIDGTSYDYELECEVAGAIGSNYIGVITPVENIYGLTSASIVGVIAPGEDEENDEDLQDRFFDSIKNQRLDGNVAQYMGWIMEYPGIGKGKVISLWNGANTVKVIILNADNEIASAELIAAFQNYLDPNSEGLGNGKAPIGSVVTVTTATSKTINVAGAVTLKEGYSELQGAEAAIKSLFSEIALTREVVGYMEIGAKLQSLPSCQWLQTLSVNGGTSDVILTSSEIPQLGTLNITVVSSP